jgi:hypothetical protein
MKKVLLTILGASALLAGLLSTGCSTEPKGTEGKIIVNDTIVSGTAGVDTITLKDADLTADTVSVKVTSSADEVGIYLTLTGSSGVYKKVLGFSTAQSTAGSVIQVSQNSMVTITYKDAKPAGTRTETFFWKAGTLAVALDHTSYMGISSAAVITVTDPNISGQTATVNVMSTSYSTAFPVTLTRTSYGQYSGNLYFTVSTAMTGKDTVHVKNGDSITVTYSNVVTPSASIAAKAGWTAIQPITVQTDASTLSGFPTYNTGLKGKMTISVVDSNVAAPTVAVHLTSHKDPTGIDLTLPYVNGGYSIQVGVSLTASGINVIAVQPPLDTMTMTYSDPAIATPITGLMRWQAGSVMILTDSMAYHGTSEQMAISATNDHTTATTLVVNVSSAKAGDTIPITLTARTDTPWVFTGTVGFSLGAKSATAVGVKDSDAVSVSYVDSVKSETMSVQVQWYSTQVPAVGLFGQHYTAAGTVLANAIVDLVPWNGNGGGCTVDSLDSLGEDGVSKAVAITGTGGWAGFGWAAVTAEGSGTLSSVDMSTYAACTLHVSVKSTTATDFSILVENLNKTAQTWVIASSVGFVADGAWHDLAIPLSSWNATCDLSNVDYFLGVSMAPYVAGETLVLDNVYWTLPATTTATPTAKKLAKKPAK